MSVSHYPSLTVCCYDLTKGTQDKGFSLTHFDSLSLSVITCCCRWRYEIKGNRDLKIWFSHTDSLMLVLNACVWLNKALVSPQVPRRIPVAIQVGCVSSMPRSRGWKKKTSYMSERGNTTTACRARRRSASTRGTLGRIAAGGIVLRYDGILDPCQNCMITPFLFLMPLALYASILVPLSSLVQCALSASLYSSLSHLACIR